MVDPKIVEATEQVTMLTVGCRFCGEQIHFDVPTEGYRKRMAGELIQNCFPNLDPKYREMMVSGMCPTCWDDTFGINEED